MPADNLPPSHRGEEPRAGWTPHPRRPAVSAPRPDTRSTRSWCARHRAAPSAVVPGLAVPTVLPLLGLERPLALADLAHEGADGPLQFAERGLEVRVLLLPLLGRVPAAEPGIEPREDARVQRAPRQCPGQPVRVASLPAFVARSRPGTATRLPPRSGSRGRSDSRPPRAPPETRWSRHIRLTRSYVSRSLFRSQWKHQTQTVASHRVRPGCGRRRSVLGLCASVFAETRVCSRHR